MTAAERLLWNAVQRRAGTVSPQMGLAILRAFQSVRDAMTETQIMRALALGGTERLFREILTQAVMDVAMQPVRERLRKTVVEQVRYVTQTLPVPPQAIKTLTIGFDTLNPRVVTAIRQLESRVVTDLTTSIRETIRQRVEQGLIAGEGPRTIAADLRALIGVPPSREVWIANYRRALESAHLRAGPLGYELRDKRFDAAVTAARRSGTPLTAAQTEKMVAGMRRKTIAYSADTVSRTATLDALKLGQRMSWDEAITKGVVDRGRLWRRWVGVMDARERPEHVAMEGDVAQFDEPFRNNEMIPGESTYGCRCLAHYFIARE